MNHAKLEKKLAARRTLDLVATLRVGVVIQFGQENI